MLQQMEVAIKDPGTGEWDESDTPGFVNHGYVFPIIGSSSSLIQIKNIDGLGPVKADIVTTPFGYTDGEGLSGSSTGKRNIVVTLGYNPDWSAEEEYPVEEHQTIEGLRHILYGYFMPKTDVKLRFTSTHLPVVVIEGVVESMEPNMFSADPEVQVSIICPTSEFVAVEETLWEIDLVSYAPAVHRPPWAILYEGTVPTGFNVKVTKGSLVSYHSTLQLSANDALLSLSLVDIDATHYFEFNSIPGEKYLRTINTAGGYENILGRVTDNNPVWPRWLPGRNDFRIYASNGLHVALTYFNRYGGL